VLGKFLNLDCTHNAAIRTIQADRQFSYFTSITLVWCFFASSGTIERRGSYILPFKGRIEVGMVLIATGQQ
jgi:hypothetical protein